jgi:hypothetical protein
LKVQLKMNKQTREGAKGHTMLDDTVSDTDLFASLLFFAGSLALLSSLSHSVLSHLLLRAL